MKNFGKANQAASFTGAKLTIPKQTEITYPTTIPIKIDDNLVIPLVN